MQRIHPYQSILSCFMAALITLTSILPVAAANPTPNANLSVAPIVQLDEKSREEPVQPDAIAQVNAAIAAETLVAPVQASPVATKGRLLFAPTIDLDNDPATNPIASQDVPVIKLVEQLGGSIALAAQIEAAEPSVPVGNVPVTFRVWHNQEDPTEYTVMSDGWGAASVEIPFADIAGSYAYQTSAPGYAATEVRRFRFDAANVSQIFYKDGGRLAYTRKDNQLFFTFHSSKPLQQGRDEVILNAMRRTQFTDAPTLADLLAAPESDAPQLGELPLPDLPMQIIDRYTARLELRLPAGDYGFIAAAIIKGHPLEQINSLPVRLLVEGALAPPTGAAVWASPIEYDPGLTLVEFAGQEGQILLDLVDSQKLPLLTERWDDNHQLIKQWRTGPFEWQEAHFDVQVQTQLTDGKKMARLANFDYDPIARRYTFAVKSLQTTTITDTLRVDVFGPGEILLKQEAISVTLTPAGILHYSIEVPVELGKPELLRVTLDDPLIEDFKAVEAAIRTLYSAISTKGEFNGFLRFYADLFRIELIRYTFSFPPGASEFKFELAEELTARPWELLVRLGGNILSAANVGIFGAIWGLIRGKDLEEIADKLLSIDLGGIGVDLGVELGFSGTADFGKCPEDTDIEQLKQRLKTIADRLDRLVADKIDFSLPLGTVPLYAIIVAKIGVRIRLGGAVNANGLTLKVTGQGSIGVTGRLAVSLPFNLQAGAYVLITRIMGSYVKKLMVYVEVVGIINEVINTKIPDGDCDPEPPDPRPPDDRQDVWQGVEAFYQGQSHAETIDNLHALIERSQAEGLTRAEKLLTLRLREAELARFVNDFSQAETYLQSTLTIMEAADLDMQAILSGTIPLSGTQTISEALTARSLEAWQQINALAYGNLQEKLVAAVDLAQRHYLALIGEELALQSELRQLFTANMVGVVASGFAEATLAALEAAGLPAQLVSPWPAGADFRGKLAPYIAPELAPRPLIMPSGGLHALVNSPSARQWLAAYVANGGLLVVFTQAFGTDFAALPGGAVAGIGYEEDQRWQHATVEAAMPSNWLVWMGIERPDIQIDGVFTSWPQNANVLLKRTAGNHRGLPVMIEYKHGTGTVLATTAYGDWAWEAGFWWGDDWQMTRALLNRAFLLGRGQDVHTIATGDPNSTVNLLFPIQNSDVFSITHVDVVLPVRLGYWGNDYRQGADLLIQPGASGTVAVQLHTPPVSRGVHSWTQVGIYRTEVTARTSNGKSFSVPGPFVYVRSPIVPPDLTLAVTANQPAVSLFQSAIVSATVRNFTAASRTVVLNGSGDLPATPVTLAVPGQSSVTHVYSLFMDRNKVARIQAVDDANQPVGEASVEVQIKLPKLSATPVIPTALADGTAIPVIVTNRALDAEALQSTLALSLTAPSGATIWHATQPLPPLAAGETITPSVVFRGTINELGSYTLFYRVIDGLGNFTLNKLFLPAQLVLAGRTDRVTYRIRETGRVTVTVSNSGQFQLASTLRVNSPAIGLNSSQPLNLAANNQQTLSYPFVMPPTLPAGAHPIELSYQVGVQLISRTLTLVVPPALIQPTLTSGAIRSGDPLIFNLLNSGGVDAPISSTVQLRDKFGQIIAAASTTQSVLAGTTATQTLLVPPGAVSGDYDVQLQGVNTVTGEPFSTRTLIAVNGLSADFSVRTDRPAYFSDEPITALADLLATGTPLDGDLELKICVATPHTEPDGNPTFQTPLAREAAARVAEPPVDVASKAADAAARRSAQQAQVRVATAVTAAAEAGVLAFTPIVGSPLQIHVATDGSYQVIHENSIPLETPGQVYWTQSAIADAGLFLWYNDDVIGPDFSNHPDGTASNFYDSWQNVQQSSVIGRGVAEDPWVIETEVAHPDSGVTMTTRTIYVDGDNFFRMDWNICLPQPAVVSTFLAADFYLQGSDNGYGFYDNESGSVGGYNATLDWFQIFTPIKPASHYYEGFYGSVWNAIGSAGNRGVGFNDTIVPNSLIDNGGGLQWDLSINGCSTVSAYWSFGETPIIPPVIPPYQNGCGFVLWETTVPVSTSTQADVSALAGVLNTTGDLLLWGRARSNTGQTIQTASYPFQVYDRDTALTIRTDKAVYRPGETVQIAGRVTNTSALVQSMDLVVETQDTPLINTALTLDPGEAYDYVTSVQATNPLTIVARAANAQTAVTPLVADPVLRATLLAPPIVGRDPFSVSVVVSNTGLVPASVQVVLAGAAPVPLVLQPGEIGIVASTQQISQDTSFTAVISGDLNQNLSQSVQQGALAAIHLPTVADDLAGLVEIRFVATATASLPLTAQLRVGVDGVVVDTRSLALLPSAPTAGSLPLNLSAGRHQVELLLLDRYGALLDQSAITVELAAVSVAAAPQPRLVSLNTTPDPVPAGGVVTVNGAVHNEGGSGPVVIGVQLFDSFQQTVITLTAGTTQSFALPLAVPEDVPSDTYFGEVTVDGEHRPIIVQVRGVDVTMTLALNKTTYQPNELANLTITLHDNAGVSGDYIIMSRYVSAEDYHAITVPANQTVQYSFPFTVTEPGRVTVFLSHAPRPELGQRVITLDSLPVAMAQPDHGAYLTFDKLVYNLGETVNLNVHIVGQVANAIVMGPLELAYRSDGFLLWQAPQDNAGGGLASIGVHPLAFTLPTTLREGRYTFQLRVDGQTISYPIDVNGYKVTTRHLTLDKPSYAPQDTLKATIEFWNEGEQPIPGLQLTAWLFTPDDGPVLDLAPVVRQAVTLQPGLNRFEVTGAFNSPAVGPHRLLINVGLPGESWRIAGGVAQLDIGSAYLVELTTDRGDYAPGTVGTGRLAVYGHGATQLTVKLNNGSTLFSQAANLQGYHSFTFAIPTAAIGDYLLVGESVDRNGNRYQLVRAYAVPAPRDTVAPAIVMTNPATRTLLTSNAPTTTLLVTGKATDNQQNLVVLVNGQVVTPTVDGSFTVPVEVGQGTNTVSVVARDRAGNITFAPLIPVTVMPIHQAQLTTARSQVSVGERITFTLVLSASSAISPVTAVDLLPTTGITEPVITATAGQVTFDEQGARWQGEVAGQQPVIITMSMRTVLTGTVKLQPALVWGYGVFTQSNQVQVQVVSTQPQLINALLRLDRMATTFDRSDPRAPAGIATITATFTNLSAVTLQDLLFQVARLTGGNLLLNADSGIGGVGSRRSVPNADLGADQLLNPGESFQVTFVIGLATRNPFDFFVDAYGTVVGGARSSAREGDNSSIHIAVGEDGFPNDLIYELFLPLVTQ